MNRQFFGMNMNMNNDSRDRRFAGRRGPGTGAHDSQERGRGVRGFAGFGHGFRSHGRGGPESGFGGRGRGGFDRGFGEGRGRLFDAGDVKLVILKLLSEEPAYGYQLIKTMEQRLSGGYTPSAGVIYPTLTMLEEEGLAISSAENNKKVYCLTPEGLACLEANQAEVGELFARLEEAGRSFERGRSPEIMKAFMNLRGAVMARVSRESVKPEQIKKITDAINAAAKAIDEL
jgi:DNA-binding PadR family transcriptional regulator